MTARVEVEQADQLRRAEAEWLRQSAARLRAAHDRVDRTRGRAGGSATEEAER